MSLPQSPEDMPGDWHNNQQGAVEGPVCLETQSLGVCDDV
jgi:hypothetical protein